MYAVLRILLILAMLGVGWCGWRFLRGGGKIWLVRARLIITVVLCLLMFFFIGLTIQRLALS